MTYEDLQTVSKNPSAFLVIGFSYRHKVIFPYKIGIEILKCFEYGTTVETVGSCPYDFRLSQTKLDKYPEIIRVSARTYAKWKTNSLLEIDKNNE